LTLPMSPLTTKQKDENRALWSKGMLAASRELFSVVGDRRSSADAMYATVKTYGTGMPPMVCMCGKPLAWEDWPNHWRDKHGI